jgi:hypothetical protein
MSGTKSSITNLHARSLPVRDSNPCFSVCTGRGVGRGRQILVARRQLTTRTGSVSRPFSRSVPANRDEHAFGNEPRSFTDAVNL